MKKRAQPNSKKFQMLLLVLILVQSILTLFTIYQVDSLNDKLIRVQIELENKSNYLEEHFNEALLSYNSENQKTFVELTKMISDQESGFQQQLKTLKLESQDNSEIIENSLKGVVSIATDKAAGSGFFINSEGYIVTNNHVIDGASRIVILRYDARIYQAELIGVNSLHDIAVLKIADSSDFLEFGDSSEVLLGKKVFAIGNPLGLSFTVTQGIVSGLDRQGPNGIEEYIQTDVTLNSGNSGGPLIDSSGKVIGINNFKVGGAEGLGFALESNQAVQVINSIINP